GAGEREYLNEADAPGVTFVQRDEISDPGLAYTGRLMEQPLKIGITCFPLIGGSGILATALGTELATRGHDVHFFSHAKPVRLDLSLSRIHFHEVEVGHATVFPFPDYTLPLAVKMAEVGRTKALDIFHVHYAVPHATAAFLAAEMIGAAAPKVVTTLHGTDTTLLGPN